MEHKRAGGTAPRLCTNDLLRALAEQNPAVALLEPSDLAIKENGEVEIAMPIQAKHTNIHGAVHGGVFVSMLDTAMGYACHLKMSSGIVTLNITTSFVANCKTGDLVKVTGHTVHAGRRIVVAEGEVRAEGGTLLATAQGTFFALGEHPADGIKSPDAIESQNTPA
jgi:acyl-CoA thioesterase